MSDKLSAELDNDVHHNEKHPVHESKGGVDLSETAGRRASVALNIVENPLQRKSPQQVVADARAFAEQNGMGEHAALFGTAALVARDQSRFEEIGDLTEDQRAALIYERDHKWHGPKMLWYSIALCAVGAATQGWDQTGSNGANLSFPQEFGIDGNGRDSWIVGLVNSIIFLTEGPVAFQYSAEVFPTIQREQGMAWAVCINNTFAGILSLTFPAMVDAMTQVGAFGFYAGLNLIAWFMIFCFVRETKQLTLEEIDQVFQVPTKKFIGHELTVWLPWFLRAKILRQNIPKPPAIIATEDSVTSALKN